MYCWLLFTIIIYKVDLTEYRKTYGATLMPHVSCHVATLKHQLHLHQESDISKQGFQKLQVPSHLYKPNE